MLYITFLILIYLITGNLYLFFLKFVPFDQLHPVFPFLASLPLVTTNVLSFSMSLFICFVRVNDLQHCVGSYYIA